MKLEDPELISFPGHTESTATNGTISSLKKKNNKPKGWLSDHYTPCKQEEIHIKGYKKLGNNLTINPSPCAATHNGEETQNPEFFPEDQRIWTLHQAPHF